MRAKRHEAKRWMANHLALENHGAECIEWPYAQNGRGYGKLSTLYTHAIVCEHFHGSRPNGRQVAHRCGNRACLNKNHLRWATPLSNTRDKESHGTNLKGEKIPWSKLTASEALQIYKDSRAYTAIAQEYGIACGSVRNIKLGVSWKHVTGGADNTKGALKGEDLPNSKLTRNQAIAIYHDTRVQRVIAKQYKIHGVTVSKIKTGKTWAHATGHGNAQQ